MLKSMASFQLLFLTLTIFSQPKADSYRMDKLTVEKIMRDPKWMGTSPSGPQWAADGKTIFFNWNPDKATADSLYFITTDNKTPVKATVEQKQNLVSANSLVYNKARIAYLYSKDADIFYTDIKTGKTKRITETTESETNPQFSYSDTKIVYNRSQNLYAWNITTGETQQLTNLKSGSGSSAKGVTENSNQQEAWLKRDQLQYFEVLRSRKEKKDLTDAYIKDTKKKELRSISIDDKILQGLGISPDGRFISYILAKPAIGNKNTIVPSYVTETGFTTDIPARTKVGELGGSAEFFIYDREKDTVLAIKTDSIHGINDLPDYIKDYPKQSEEKIKKPAPRPVNVYGPYWSPNGEHAVVEIRSDDNKDRWLMLWDTATNKLKLLDRQRDEAWVDGPGTFGILGWINENSFCFQSEATGYSHIYLMNVTTGEKKALTEGKYEVQRARLSNDKNYFYITTNEVRQGEQHFYKLNIATGKKEKISTQTGSNQVTVSPDEKYLAILYSYANKPWELYLQENNANGKAAQITSKAQSDEFKSYSWKDPELISFAARDGATVYARLYKPANPHPNKPAILFVHGAGYLQNAHKWWSSYFR